MHCLSTDILLKSPSEYFIPHMHPMPWVSEGKHEKSDSCRNERLPSFEQTDEAGSVMYPTSENN